MISDVIFTIAGLGLLLLLLTAALSPLETLSWWAGWTDRELSGEDQTDPDPEPGHAAKKVFIVYLSGIASISGRFLIARERAFLDGLATKLPDATVISNVFPYSPKGLPLLGAQRFFNRLWRMLQKTKLDGRQSLLSLLINMRNVFQVMVSADHRYGPIFNQGAAHVIESALLRAGYRANARIPIVLIGYSGGAQIAVGAAPFLRARFKAPIDIVSIGGVMASDPGLHIIRRLDHFCGANDRVEKVGATMFPERWSLLAHSEWNQAKKDGRVRIHRMADMGHAGPRGYFGLPKKPGGSNNERLQAVVADALSSANR